MLGRSFGLLVVVGVLLALPGAGLAQNLGTPGRPTLGLTNPPPAPVVPPFATAPVQGYGRNTVGGAGGVVCEVTRLDDPPVYWDAKGVKSAVLGTLRYCVMQAGPRQVVFKKAGTITLGAALVIENPYITIDGSTAPAGGVAVRGHLTAIQTSEVIIRHMRFRPGANVPASEIYAIDALDILNGNNIVIDHVSMMWAPDENFSIWPIAGQHVTNVTIQWSIIGQALKSAFNQCFPQSAPPKVCTSNAQCGGGACVPNDESFGALLSDHGGGTMDRVSFHHVLFAANNDRNPEIGATGTFELVNNVISGPFYEVALTTYHSGDTLKVDHIANYHQTIYQPNPYLRGIVVKTTSAPGSTAYVYLNGNVDSRDRPVVTAGNDCDVFAFDGVAYPSWGVGPGAPGQAKACDTNRWPTRFNTTMPVTATTAAQAFQDVLAGAGATLPYRDSVDRWLVDGVRAGAKGVINKPEDLGPNPWPDYSQ